MKNVVLLTYTILCLVTSNCGVNIFKETSNKTSDESLYYDAKVLIDKLQYLEAISLIESLSDTFKAREEVQRTYGTALAGQCGFKFSTFLIALGDSSAGFPFGFAMNSFKGITTYRDYCKNAESVIRSILAAGTLDVADYSLFMSLLSLAKMGAILHETADLDGINNLGDGVTDLTFSACDADKIADADLDHIITGLALFIENFSSLAAALSGGGADIAAQLAIIQNNCRYTFDSELTTPEALRGQTIDPCSTTDVADVNVNMRYLFRSLLQSNDFGVGACDVATETLGLLDCCQALRIQLYGI